MIDRESRFEAIGIERLLGGPHPGVIDEPVEAPEVVPDRREGFLCGGLVGDVGNDTITLTASVLFHEGLRLWNRLFVLLRATL